MKSIKGIQSKSALTSLALNKCLVLNTQHTGKTTIGRLKPLFPHIQRLMDDDDEMIKTVMRTVTRILGEEVTQLMDTQGMENLISLYIKERDLATLGK